jgi:7-carboxy-7-deazaguanine synthase
MGDVLRLVEWFWTFQGEGANWGRRAFFVRLPYCNLKCTWCDTEFNKFVTVTEEQFLRDARSEKTKFAVLTGGEPTMNKQLPRIIALLKSFEFEIAVETNGCFKIPDGIDFVTVSPKRDADYRIHPHAQERANELKYVIDKDFDFSILTRLQEQEWTRTKRLTVSPEFNDMKESVSRIENFLKENPRWRMSLQTHKWLGVR